MNTMKIQNVKLIFSLILVFVFNLSLHAIDINQSSGTFSLSDENYAEYMEEVWDINIGSDLPVKLTYTYNIGEFDNLYILSVDKMGNTTVVGQYCFYGSGSVSTIIPSGKARIIFCADGCGGFINGYTGFSINFSADSSFSVSDNSYLTGSSYVHGSSTVDGNAIIRGSANIYGNSTISKKLSVGSSSTSGNSIIYGNLGIGTTNPTSKLHILTTVPSGIGGAQIAFTQTQTSLTNGTDNGLSLLSILQASSSTDQTCFRGALMRTDNCLTGGGVVQNQRVLNLVSGSITGSKTTNLDMILMETGGSTGTTTNAYGLHLVSLPGINKWGIYDQSGSKWYTNGKVGIGDVAPGAKLSVVGNAAIGYASGQAAPENGMIVSGNVGIGTTNPQYLLDVKGTVRATEVKIVSVGAFSDFVFDKDYQLPKLSEVHNYIQEEGHLPNIPSAAEVKENGMSLVDMQVKLLQKIEELTLYAIEQQKEIENLKKALGAYNKK